MTAAKLTILHEHPKQSLKIYHLKKIKRTNIKVKWPI